MADAADSDACPATCLVLYCALKGICAELRVAGAGKAAAITATGAHRPARPAIGKVNWLTPAALVYMAPAVMLLTAKLRTPWP